MTTTKQPADAGNTNDELETKLAEHEAVIADLLAAYEVAEPAWRGWWVIVALAVGVGWWFSSWGPSSAPLNAPDCTEIATWANRSLSRNEDGWVSAVERIRPSEAGWGERVCSATLKRPAADPDELFDFPGPDRPGALCSNWRGSQVYAFPGLLGLEDPVVSCLQRLRGER